MIEPTAQERAELRSYFPFLSQERRESSLPESSASGSPAPGRSFQSRLQQEISGDPQKERLYEAAVDFQALFIKQLLNAMRSSLRPEEGLLYGGFRQKIFEDMLFDHYADLLSRQEDFYLAEQLYRQLSLSPDSSVSDPSPSLSASSPAPQTSPASVASSANPDNPASVASSANPDNPASPASPASLANPAPASASSDSSRQLRAIEELLQGRRLQAEHLYQQNGLPSLSRDALQSDGRGELGRW